MLKNKTFSSLMVLVVLMTSFSNYNVPSCMDTLVTNPFIKLSLIFFITYSLLKNNKTSLLVSVLIYLILENNEKIVNKPIDEEISAEIVLENEIKELEKEVTIKDEISKELEKIESDLEEEVTENNIEEEVTENNIEEVIDEVTDEITDEITENNINEDSNLLDEKIKEVINIKSSRGITDNCKECSFLKSDDYNIRVEELSGYESNNYYNIN
jgi:RNA polymerase-binding transcription factor DksA